MNISKPIGLDEYNSDSELKNVVLFVGYPDVTLTLISLLCIVFIAIGVPGNFITIVSFIRSKQIQNATAIFIINLSVADLLFCALILPVVMVSYWTRSWIFGRAMCRLYPLLNYTLVTVSLFTVLAIAINRYVIICHPTHYRKLYTKMNIFIMLIIMWTFALGTGLIPFFGLWGRMSFDRKSSACTIISDTNNISLKETILPTLTFTTGAIILLCYIRILLVVMKSSLRSKTRTPGTIPLYSTTHDVSTVSSNIIDESDIVENGLTQERPQSVVQLSSHQTNRKKKKLPTKKDKKLCTMVSAIMICLIVCYVPITVTRFFCPESDTCPTCNIIGHILIYAAPSLNPILYVLMSKEYRQAYKSVITCYH